MGKRGRWELVPGGRPITDLLEFRSMRRRKRVARVVWAAKMFFLGIVCIISLIPILFIVPPKPGEDDRVS